MSVSREQFIVTVDSAGAGTVTSSVVSGVVLEVRSQSTGLLTGGSADITLTRVEDGGTVIAITNQSAAPFSYYPRPGANSVTAGTTSYAVGIGPVPAEGVPVDGELKLVVAQAAPSTSGTVNVYYRS